VALHTRVQEEQDTHKVALRTRVQRVKNSLSICNIYIYVCVCVCVCVCARARHCSHMTSNLLSAYQTSLIPSLSINIYLYLLTHGKLLNSVNNIF
jgi:hypothetical protein